MSSGRHSEYPHLTVEAGDLLNAPVQHRVDYFATDRWIPYPHATLIINRLQRYVDRARTNRMPCNVVFGPSNNGKSHLAKRIRERNPPHAEDETGRPILPVLLIPTTPSSGEQEYWHLLLEAMAAAHDPSAPKNKLKPRALRLLQEYETRLIILDEFNIAANAVPKKQREILDAVRETSVATNLSIACFGTQQALNLVKHDDAFTNRFKPLELSPWACDRQWQVLLARFEALAPLKKPSGLAQRDFAQVLHRQTSGCIGELYDLLVELLEFATYGEAPSITQDMIEECGWVAPARRREFT